MLHPSLVMTALNILISNDGLPRIMPPSEIDKIGIIFRVTYRLCMLK